MPLYYTSCAVQKDTAPLESDDNQFTNIVEKHIFDCYELLPDEFETKCKAWFDIDKYVGEISTEDAAKIHTIIASIMHEQLYNILNECYDGVVHPRLQVKFAQSHGTSSKGKKISFRIYIPNVITYPFANKMMAQKLNSYLNSPEFAATYNIDASTNFRFDESVYKNNQKVRCVNTSKDGETRPLLLMGDSTVEDTVITGCFAADAVTFWPPPPPPIEYDMEPVEFNPENVSKNATRFTEYAAGIKDFSYGNRWKMACFCHNQIGTVEGYVPFIQWCASDPAYSRNPDWQIGNEIMWNSVEEATSHTQKRIGLTGLKKILEKENPTLAAELDTKWRNIDRKSDVFLAFSEGENSVAKMIAPLLKDKLVYCQEKWYMFNETTNRLWEKTSSVDSTIIQTMQDILDEERSKLLADKAGAEKKAREAIEAKVETLTRYYRDCCRNSFGSQVKKLLGPHVKDNTFTSKLNATKYIAAFQDGIYDIKTGEFRKGLLASDYLTATIPMLYRKPDPEKTKWVKHELKKICNYNDAHLEYYLSMLGLAMTGDSSAEQALFFLLGQTAGNGKSVPFDALAEIAPNYVKNVQNNTFEKGQEGTRHKTIATWLGIRLLYANELSKRKQDVDFLKQIADGSSIEYNAMYAEATSMAISFYLFIIGNHTLSFESDNGMARRLRVSQLDSKFSENITEDDPANCTFVRDKHFTEKLIENGNEFLHLIFSYGAAYAAEGKMKPYPEDWSDEAKEVVNMNTSASREWINENFSFGPELKTRKSKIDQMIKNKFPYKDVKDELKKMGLKMDKAGNYWMGLQFNEPTETNEEVNIPVIGEF